MCIQGQLEGERKAVTTFDHIYVWNLRLLLSSCRLSRKEHDIG